MIYIVRPTLGLDAVTYSQSTQSDLHCSTIDLVFGGRETASQISQWDIVEVPGFESDHRVTQTILNIQPNRVANTRLDWGEAYKEPLITAVTNSLRGLDTTTALPTDVERNNYATDFIDRLNEAITATLPQKRPRPPPPDLRTVPDVKSAFNDAWRLLKGV